MLCPTCGTTLPDGARFCGTCGTSLGPPAPAPGAIPEPPPIVPDPTLSMPAYPPTPPPPTAYAPAPPPGDDGGSKKGVLLAVVAVLVVLALGAGAFFVFGGDDPEVASGGDDEVGVVLLEPVGVQLENDFAGNLEEDRPGGNRAPAMRGLPPLGEAGAAAKRRGAALETDADEPGLYGGSRDVGTCDIEQLVDFLTDDENADKAEAWAGVHDIDVDEIEEFIDGLTAVRLRYDTRVTNHGLTDGEATPAQSILEAGTAVLVDDTGVPRVKCNCGNPLLEPEEVGDEPEIVNEGDAWDDFDVDQVVVVQPVTQIDIFVLIDIDTGDLFQRPAGTDGDEDDDVDEGILDDLCGVLGDSPTCGDGGDDTTTTPTTEPPDDTTTSTTEAGPTTTIVLGTGDVQVTLRWDSAADLDLAVVDPNGERVSFGGTSSSGGQHDVDTNVGCVAEGSVENIFWPEGAAPSGSYLVEVDGFDAESCGQSGAFVLTVTVDGQAQTFQGDVTDESTATFEFRVP